MRKKYKGYLAGFGKYKLEVEEIKEPRESGFYWCIEDGKWTIQEWLQSSQKWNLNGTVSLVNDTFFDAIHENKIEEPPYKLQDLKTLPKRYENRNPK
jgi:hypothetical protein